MLLPWGSILYNTGWFCFLYNRKKVTRESTNAKWEMYNMKDKSTYKPKISKVDTNCCAWNSNQYKSDTLGSLRFLPHFIRETMDYFVVHWVVSFCSTIIIAFIRKFRATAQVYFHEENHAANLWPTVNFQSIIRTMTFKDIDARKPYLTSYHVVLVNWLNDTE